MFIVLLKYLKSLDEVDLLIPAHRDFLKRYYDNGNFLLSGRQEPRTGGVIFARAKNRTELENIIQEDPFCVAGLAKYEIVEFVPTMAAEHLAALVPAS